MRIVRFNIHITNSHSRETASICTWESDGSCSECKPDCIVINKAIFSRYLHTVSSCDNIPLYKDIVLVSPFSNLCRNNPLISSWHNCRWCDILGHYKLFSGNRTLIKVTCIETACSDCLLLLKCPCVTINWCLFDVNLCMWNKCKQFSIVSVSEQILM